MKRYQNRKSQGWQIITRFIVHGFTKLLVLGCPKLDPSLQNSINQGAHMTDSVLKDTVNALRDKLVVEDLRQPGKVKFPLVPGAIA